MSFFSNKNKTFLLISFLVLGFFIAWPIDAGVDDNVSGWAWSENIGWISFNNTSGGGGIIYGVNIDSSTGVFSGYAWSENIGWISFERSDTGAPPAPPYDGSEDFIAKLDLQSNEASGWAKALDADAWIKLRDTSYGVFRDTSISPTNEFKDWAWSDTVIGWISFNCIDRGVCGTSDYKVVIDIDSIDPVVDVFNINPASPNWVSSTVVFDVSWTVSDSGGSHLSHVEIWKALYNDTDCSDTNKDGCVWSKVGGNYNAPADSDLWTSSVSDSPLEDGKRWYGLHVLDNADNMGTEDLPIKALIDQTQPTSQIQSPVSGNWYTDDFSLDTFDEDLYSGLDYCEYKVLSYNCQPISPDCEYSTDWQPRTCNTSSQTITVGAGGNCPYEGSQACWAYIRSKDNADNWHSPYFEENSSSSIQYYNIDFTDPIVGEISPLTATQGIEQTFTASLDDSGSISACWLYKKNRTYQPQPNPVSIFPTSIEVNYIFATSDDYYMKFACRDAAGKVGWGNEVLVSVAENLGNSAPSITSLNYYTAHSSTPDQQCTDQFVCCMDPTTQTDCSVKFNISAYDLDDDPLTYTWDFADETPNSNDEDPSHYYASANTYNVSVDVFDGTEHTQDTLVVTVNDPTISVGLTADPAFGTDSLSGVDLRAIVAGSMFGAINYKLDCTNDSIWELEVSNQTVDDYTAVDVCSYASVGDYVSKAFVQRGEGSAEDTANINVVASECTPGQQTNCTSPQGCSHTITCQADSTWPSCPTDECVKDSVRSCGNCGEQTCLLTCSWGVCEGEGECTLGPDCPDCLCLPDVCVGQDYYDYPDFGDCIVGCNCDTGTGTGQPCEPNIIVDAPQCNIPPVCDSLDATPDSGVAPLNVLFTGSAHDDNGTITQYEFDFGEGSPVISSENTINYTYNNSGIFCAKLRVQDNDGAWTSTPGDCPDVCTKQINISENDPPSAAVSCDGSGCGPGSACDGSWIAYNRNCQFYFLNDSTDPNSTNPPDDNNDIVKSTWSIFYQDATPWQDPYIICTDNPVTPENEGICDLLLPTLPASQNYYITLTVEDSVGATDSLNRNFYVRREIAADFQCSFDSDGGWQSCNGFVASEGEAVYFKDTSVISEGSTAVSSWNWTFEDGSPSSSNEQNPSASFVNLSANSGTVTLDITDNAGRTDSESYQLQITIPLPEWEEVVP
ncbi:MAG: PKD domain-containing protein [Candidatus Nealsonbacteria bacterium]